MKKTLSFFICSKATCASLKFIMNFKCSEKPEDIRFVRQFDRNFFSILNHVVVRHNMSVAVYEEPCSCSTWAKRRRRSLTILFFPAVWRRQTEKSEPVVQSVLIKLPPVLPSFPKTISLLPVVNALKESSPEL